MKLKFGTKRIGEFETWLGDSHYAFHAGKLGPSVPNCLLCEKVMAPSGLRGQGRMVLAYHFVCEDCDLKRTLPAKGAILDDVGFWVIQNSDNSKTIINADTNEKYVVAIPEGPGYSCSCKEGIQRWPYCRHIRAMLSS